MMQTVYRLIEALANNDTAVLDTILPANAYLQIQGNGRMEIYWTRPRVKAALLADFGRWQNMMLKIGDVSPLHHAITVTYHMEVVEDGHLVSHNRFAVMVLDNDQVQTMILYCYDESIYTPPGVWSISFPSAGSSVEQMGIA